MFTEAAFLNSCSRIPILVRPIKPEKRPKLNQLTHNKTEVRQSFTTSKIPVPKQLEFSLELNSKNRNILGRNLTAAVRRQKFHQSRCPVANVDEPNLQSFGLFPVCSASVSLPSYSKFLPALFSKKNLGKVLSNKSQNTCGSKSERLEAGNCAEHFSVEKPSRHQHFLPDVLLPPISIDAKCVNSITAIESQQGKKKKGFGEFTHFPAICNVLPFKAVKLSSPNSATILPKISCSPLAPPPSISSSLEKDVSPLGSVYKFKMQDFCEGKTNVASTQKLVPQIEKSSTSLGYQEILPPHLVHTVSIVIEPVDVEISEAKNDSSCEEDTNSASCDSTVKTLMDLAQLRKEAFVRLLEEHAEIVEEIKKAETGQI